MKNNPLKRLGTLVRIDGQGIHIAVSDDEADKGYGRNIEDAQKEQK
jgi:hypothetical protein